MTQEVAKSINYDKAASGLEDDAGNQTINLGDISPDAGKATIHQASLVPGTVTEGTVAVMVKWHGTADFIALKIDNVAVVADFTDPDSLSFSIKDARLAAWRFDPADIDGTWGINVTGWQ
jgi:hypothetical protein